MSVNAGQKEVGHQPARLPGATPQELYKGVTAWQLVHSSGRGSSRAHVIE